MKRSNFLATLSAIFLAPFVKKTKAEPGINISNNAGKITADFPDWYPRKFRDSTPLTALSGDDTHGPLQDGPPIKYLKFKRSTIDNGERIECKKEWDSTEGAMEL